MGGEEGDHLRHTGTHQLWGREGERERENGGGGGGEGGGRGSDSAYTCILSFEVAEAVQ